MLIEGEGIVESNGKFFALRLPKAVWQNNPKLHLPADLQGKPGLMFIDDPELGRFEDNYELSKASYGFDPRKQEKPRILGNKKNRTCLICGKSMPQATFRKRAHIIPQGLGNRHLRTYAECDDCNHRVGGYEDSLIKYFAFVRALIGTPTKNKPHAILKSKTSKISTNDAIGKIEIETQTGEHEGIQVSDMGEKSMHMDVPSPPFNPFYICKALVHMGVLALDNEAKTVFPQAIEWISDFEHKIDFAPAFYREFVPGWGFKNEMLKIWIAKTDKVPSAIVELTFGMVCIGMYIPTKNFKLPSHPYPPLWISPLPPYAPTWELRKDIKDQLLRPAGQKVDFAYDKKTEVKPNENK